MELTEEIRGSVRDHRDKRYLLYGSTASLVFGVHAIDIGDFIRCLAIKLEVPQIAVFPGR